MHFEIRRALEQMEANPTMEGGPLVTSRDFQGLCFFIEAHPWDSPGYCGTSVSKVPRTNFIGQNRVPLDSGRGLGEGSKPGLMALDG